MASNLEAMASNLRAMASNLDGMASNLRAMASNLIRAMESGMASNLIKNNGLQPNTSNCLQPN